MFPLILREKESYEKSERASCQDSVCNGQRCRVKVQHLSSNFVPLFTKRLTLTCYLLSKCLILHTAQAVVRIMWAGVGTAFIWMLIKIQYQIIDNYLYIVIIFIIFLICRFYIYIIFISYIKLAILCKLTYRNMRNKIILLNQLLLQE